MGSIVAEAHMLAEQAEACGGIEVEKDDWPAAEEAVRLGLASRLGPARGPGGMFKRLYPMEEE